MTDARTMTFDAQATETLQRLGFDVAADRQSAHVAGAVEITVTRPIPERTNSKSRSHCRAATPCER